MSDPLELVSFRPSAVVAGSRTGWRAGELAVDLGALGSSASEAPGIASAEVEIVRPGDRVRVLHVLDAVDPCVKAHEPGTTFPGVLSPGSSAGAGRTHRLEGVAVLSVCDLRGSTEVDGLPDSVVDMTGPGAPLSAWSTTTNVVVRFEPEAGAPIADLDRSIRVETLRIARDLAAATLDGGAPEPAEVLRVEPRAGAEPSKLPGVCVVLQVGAEGTFADTFLYGSSMEGTDPRVLEPAEILDGALTSGAYDWAGLRNPTAFYQRNRLIRELLAADGSRLRFAGVIVALGYLSSAAEKARSAEHSAQLARRLGADGAILTTYSSGNSHTDTMLTVRACSKLGIATTAILAETNGGLTDHIPEADSIVSVGNEDELVPGWVPQRVIGGSRLADARAADDGAPIPASTYLGALCEMGDMALKAVPA